MVLRIFTHKIIIAISLVYGSTAIFAYLIFCSRVGQTEWLSVSFFTIIGTNAFLWGSDKYESTRYFFSKYSPWFVTMYRSRSSTSNCNYWKLQLLHLASESNIYWICTLSSNTGTSFCISFSECDNWFESVCTDMTVSKRSVSKSSTETLITFTLEEKCMILLVYRSRQNQSLRLLY